MMSQRISARKAGTRVEWSIEFFELANAMNPIVSTAAVKLSPVISSEPNANGRNKVAEAVTRIPNHHIERIGP